MKRDLSWTVLWVGLLLTFLPMGCGGQKTNGADAAGVNAAITVAPASAKVTVGQSQAFTADLSLGHGFLWSVVPASLGTFSGDGVFTAKAAGAGVIVATWAADTRYVGTTTVQTFPAPDATITTPQVVTAAANATTAAVPSQPECTYDWTITGGTITDGAGTANIHYVATDPDAVTLHCTVTNPVGTQAQYTFVVKVEDPPAILSFQGLPRVVRPGASTVLQATFRGTRAILDPGHLDITQTGMAPIPLDASTTFTLTVSNDAGAQVQAVTVVQVGDPCPPADPAPGDLWLDPATGLSMVWCPSGSFTMGAGADDAEAMENERPAHAVAFSRGFWLSRTKITQAQWTAVMGSNPSYFQDLVACTHFGLETGRPVEQVSWQDAQAFLNRLNAQVGWSAYRLPSEAEWEYAFRAGTTTPYAWGDPAESGHYAIYAADSDLMTSAVQQRTPNGWGLADMAGETQEWVADTYQPDFQGAPADGSAVLGLTLPWRTLRGSAWSEEVPFLRASARHAREQGQRLNTVGFRIARTACAAPVITSFQASPAGPLPSGGGRVTLAWHVDGATRVWMDQGVGEITGRSATAVDVDATRTFVLVAENAEGWVMTTATVEVNP
jgi:formylglycine-generating enzyme required for sulfatase activity